MAKGTSELPVLAETRPLAPDKINLPSFCSGQWQWEYKSKHLPAIIAAAVVLRGSPFIRQFWFISWLSYFFPKSKCNLDWMASSGARLHLMIMMWENPRLMGTHKNEYTLQMVFLLYAFSLNRGDTHCLQVLKLLIIRLFCLEAMVTGRSRHTYKMMTIPDALKACIFSRNLQMALVPPLSIFFFVPVLTEEAAELDAD